MTLVRLVPPVRPREDGFAAIFFFGLVPAAMVVEEGGGENAPRILRADGAHKKQRLKTGA